MSADNRPLSPHLSIYKPQLTSVLSILHRATGVVITIGAVCIAYWLWSITSGNDCYDCIREFINSKLGVAGLVIWTACTCYHLLNGVRHLFWDFGCGFELNQAYISGYIVLAATLALTALVWLL